MTTRTSGSRLSMTALVFSMTALVLMTAVGPVASADRAAEALIDGPPIVSVGRAAEGGHLLNASFAVAASPEVAWQVLTDYAGLPAFVESMKRSVVVTRKKGLLQVEQEGAGRFAFVTRRFHVVLTIQEHAAKGRLDFHRSEERRVGKACRYRC